MCVKTVNGEGGLKSGQLTLLEGATCLRAVLEVVVDTIGAGETSDAELVALPVNGELMVSHSTSGITAQAVSTYQ